MFGNNFNKSKFFSGINQGMLAIIQCRIVSSSLLSKNLKIKMYRTIILSVVYGCETWSLTLR
jgi:hypothetical protein